MKHNVISYLKQHPKIYNVLFMMTVYVKRQALFAFHYFFRKLNLNNQYNYSKLEAFKNIHKNQRCFVIGTGPSLRIRDLELLKNEITFSVNSIVLSFPDTYWRPTYYAIQDSKAYNKLKNEILYSKMPYVFCGISDKKLTPNFDVDFIPFPLNLLDHGKATTNHINKFSDDAYKVVYDGHSITYSVLQLAVYMGFKEIILLGVDCDYSKAVNHIKAYSLQDDNNAAFLMKESFVIAEQYAIRNNIKILNATRNTSLDVFKRVDLEDILNQNVQKSSSTNY